MTFCNRNKTNYLLFLMMSVWVCSSLIFFTKVCIAVDHSESYSFQVRSQSSSYSSQYEVMISISSSLYDFYYDSSHYVPLHGQAMFVTPFTVRPVADSVQKVCGNGTNSDEAFADAVLDIVHQLTYDASTDWQYPIETLVTGSGKCDTLSFLAASIMKAGGLDVVLLIYESANHMAIGVKLDHEPIYIHTDATKGYINYSSTRYWVAECTPGVYENTGEPVPWQQGKRVGETSNVMQGTPRVISLQSQELRSSEQVSAYLTCSPTLSLNLSEYNVTVGQQTVLSGQLSVPFAGSIEILVHNENTPSWSTLASINTSSSGIYSYLWSLQEKGVFYIQASFKGLNDSDMTINAAQSTSQEVYVYPFQRNPTTISIDVSSKEVTVGDSVTITGKLSIPAQAQVEINIRSNEYGYSWTLASVSTDLEGTYTYAWHPETVDKYWLSVSFPGDIDNYGTTSSEFMISVHPTMLAVIIAYAPYIGAIGGIAGVASCIFLFLRRKRSQKSRQASPPSPPPPPPLSQLSVAVCWCKDMRPRMRR